MQKCFLNTSVSHAELTGPHWLARVALCSLIAGCAARAPENSSRGSTSNPVVAGSSGNASTHVGAASPIGSSDNPNGLVTTLADASVSTQTMPAAASTSSSGPISIDQTGAGNPAGLPDADVQKLIAGGAPGSMKWLYPYDGTVFPRGMIAPLLMWDGPAADVAYVHIKAQAFEYKGVLKVTQGMGPQLQIPQDVWDKAGQKTAGKSDTFSLELTARAGGAIAGPIVSHFTIAQATVKGSIYYNTYASKLSGAAVGGNVLRIPAGGQAELFLSTTCNGCHSVAAAGSRMISQISLFMGGNSYQLAPGGKPNPMGVMVGPRTSFGALYPDGSKYLATSVAIEVARSALTQGTGASADATLYDTTTGQVVPDTAVPSGALMPTFSPDGKHLVFNDNAIGMAHGLAVMAYDTNANKASNYKMLMQQPDGKTRPAWPFFLPDANAVVFVLTDSTDFSGGGAGLNGQAGLAPVSDLSIADVASGKVTLLAKAMGYNTAADAANGTTYLPFPADDQHHTYFPTMSPVAAGGYFWLFFDAMRHYGNLGLQRQLWGVAIDIQANGNYQLDPSHPAFYLPGQELGAGNHRAFAALDPCKKDGDSCKSGIDCCGGFCFIPENASHEFVEPTGTCSPKMTCAKRDERCTTSADCCPPTMGEPQNSCIAGFCAFIQLN
jgi:hypothetical protein